MNVHRQAIVKQLQAHAFRHDTYRLFSDFCELSALSLANAVDLSQREGREGRYLEIAKGYTAAEMQLFPRLLAEVVSGLELEACDLLGAVFHDLELHNKARGQFFTPFELCRMMAKMTLGSRDELCRMIEDKGYVSASEPACGAGAMVIALATEIHGMGINYQRHLHVTAVDVDRKAAHMAYIQFSLLHIPAVVVVGNSITLEEREHWYTPAHILGGWSQRLRQGRAMVEIETVQPVEQTAPLAPAPVRVGQMALF